MHAFPLSFLAGIWRAVDYPPFLEEVVAIMHLLDYPCNSYFVHHTSEKQTTAIIFELLKN